MEDKKELAQVPYYAFESTTERLTRVIKWLVIILIVTLSLFFLSNSLWIYYFNQYDYEYESEDVILDGEANYVQGNGGIFNGQGNSQTQATDQEEEALTSAEA